MLVAFLITAAVAGQLSEMTRRAAAEAEAREADARLASAKSRTLFEASPDALVTIDTSGAIDDANSAIEIMTGRPLSALAGTDFSSYSAEPDEARDACRQTLRDGFVRDWPLELLHVDGHLTSVFYSATVRHDDDGHVIGIVAAIRPVLTSPARESDRAGCRRCPVRGARRRLRQCIFNRGRPGESCRLGLRHRGAEERHSR